MDYKTPSRMQVVRKQEKEPRLRNFISSELAGLSACSGQAADLRCLIVARTIDSPVVRALAAFSAELDRLGIGVRAIFSSLDVATEQPGAAPPALCVAAWDVRWARNPRLVDAHEALLLGASAVWIGDSMRRDPDKRDAFELHCPTGVGASQQAARSFERLWQLSVPVSRSRRWTARPAVLPAAEPVAAATDVPAAAPAQDANAIPTPGATRH